MKPSTAKARRLYNKMAREYLLQNPQCAVFKNKPASEVHHRRGRLGTLLIDQRFWLAVSKEGHYLIHHHPVEAQKRKFICERGQWNTAPKDDETARLKEVLRG